MYYKKSFFLETVEEIDEEFCFVNLNMDLYKPTLEGLKFFWTKMVNGGIILVHDYFSKGYEGVNKAVEEFLQEVEDAIIPFAIGDGVSIGLQKKKWD